MHCGTVDKRKDSYLTTQSTQKPADKGNHLLHCYEFIDSKKSAFVFVLRSFSIRNSMPSVVPMGIRTRRKTHILDRSSLPTKSSSLRVPDFVISIAGKVRLSESLRSNTISEFPVPLNSSKITSSI